MKRSRSLSLSRRQFLRTAGWTGAGATVGWLPGCSGDSRQAEPGDVPAAVTGRMTLYVRF